MWIFTLLQGASRIAGGNVMLQLVSKQTGGGYFVGWINVGMEYAVYICKMMHFCCVGSGLQCVRSKIEQ